jgi:hypothetical protein
MSAITITFGDQAENHAGMQKIGKMAKDGYSLEDLTLIAKTFRKKRGECELIDLVKEAKLDDEKDVEPAYILILRKGVEILLRPWRDRDSTAPPTTSKYADNLYEELSALDVDKKALMRGRVVNKHARHNLCFAEFPQEPDYENGKGRIVAYCDVPYLEEVRENLISYMGHKAVDMHAEGNFYYDLSKCGIGFHGDSERKRVIGIRLGESFPLHYQWYQNTEPIGKRIKIENLEHGDVYIMSEKAVGTDWKKRKIPTLRHAAGCKKFIK